MGCVHQSMEILEGDLSIMPISGLLKRTVTPLFNKNQIFPECQAFL